MNDDITPRGDIQENSQTDCSVGERLVDKARGNAATSMYLAVFTISPSFIIIFNDWAFIPALALSLFVLWRAYVLKKQGLNTIVLRIATFIMLILSIDSFFLWTPIKARSGNYFAALAPELFNCAVYVALVGAVTLLVFAIMAIIYGIKSRRIIKNHMARIGIYLGSTGILFWFGLVIWAVYTLIDLRSGAGHEKMLW